MDTISIGDYAVISQGTHLCAGSYMVLLAGTSRRGLTRQQRVVTGWVLGAAIVLFGTMAATVVTAVLLLIKVLLLLGTLIPGAWRNALVQFACPFCASQTGAFADLHRHGLAGACA